MKKNLALLLAVVLVLSSLVGLTMIPAGAEATATAPSQEIAYFNVSIGTNVSLLFAVPADGYTVNEDGTVDNLQLLVWQDGQSEGKYNKKDAEVNGKVLEAQGLAIINGVKHIIFTYSELSAAQMSETVYARLLCHDAKGFRSYSEIYDYSIAEFANGYLNSTNALHNKKELVSAMMDYGAFAAIYNNKINGTSYKAYNAEATKDLKKVTVNAVINGVTVATSKQLVEAGKETALAAPIVDGAELKSWGSNATDGKITVASGASDVSVTATYAYKSLYSYDIEASSLGAYRSSMDGQTYGTLKIGSGNPNISNNFANDAENKKFQYSKYIVVGDEENKYVKVSHNGASQLAFDLWGAPSTNPTVNKMTGIGDTVGFTFEVDLMANKNGTFPSTNFHIYGMGTATANQGKNGYMFSLNADGSVTLHGTAVQYGDINTTTIIAAGEASSDSFQTVAVYVDFAEARIYGYLEGELKAVAAFKADCFIPSEYLASLDNLKNSRFQVCIYGNRNWNMTSTSNATDAAKACIADLNGVPTPVYNAGTDTWNHEAIEAYVDANLYFYYDNVRASYGNTAAK